MGNQTVFRTDISVLRTDIYVEMNLYRDTLQQARTGNKNWPTTTTKCLLIILNKYETLSILSNYLELSKVIHFKLLAYRYFMNRQHSDFLLIPVRGGGNTNFITGNIAEQFVSKEAKKHYFVLFLACRQRLLRLRGWFKGQSCLSFGINYILKLCSYIWCKIVFFILIFNI